MKPEPKTKPEQPLENYQGKRREQVEFSGMVILAAAAGIVALIAICKIYEFLIKFF